MNQVHKEIENKNNQAVKAGNVNVANALKQKEEKVKPSKPSPKEAAAMDKPKRRTENKRQTGTRYEEAAAAYLAEKGYTILARNYRNRCGEIDLIAEKEAVLVFLEIKFRASDSRGDPLEAVDVRKQRRICKAAIYYYAQMGYTQDVPCRFDVIGIYGDGAVRHIEGAFDFQY